MKVSYFREMREHHLVITDGEYICPDYQIKMVQENEISGLFRPVTRRVDEETEYDYSITGCQSLQTFVEGEPISGKVLGILVEALCRLLEEMERYLIDGKYLGLRPEFIYLKREREEIAEVRYCFFPFQEQALEEQLRTLFKFITNEVDYQDKDTVNLAYELYQVVLREPAELSDLRNVVERMTERRAAETLVVTPHMMGSQTAGPQMAESQTVGPRIAESQMIGPGSGALQLSVQQAFGQQACERRTATQQSSDGGTDDTAERESAGTSSFISAEEILWMDDAPAGKTPQKRMNRKSADKREITLPDQRKKSILGLINRR